MEGTPLPGRVLAGPEAGEIIEQCLKKFRGPELNGIPSNVPTACTLVGYEDEHLFQSRRWPDHESLYVLFEYPRELRQASGEAVKEFLRSKEPWEDYDLCIFGTNLSWCVGVTHNAKVLVVDEYGFFDRLK